MRTVNDPQGGHVPLVDKMIGNAYEVVKHVAMNMKYIRHVSNNLEAIFDVSTQLKALQAQTTITGVAGNANVAVNLKTGVDAKTITAANVQITGSDGAIYFPGQNTFSFYVLGTDLVITTALGAPAALINGAIKALVSYTPAA